MASDAEEIATPAETLWDVAEAAGADNGPTAGEGKAPEMATHVLPVRRER